ncbi:hypothetical protein HMPREF3196_01266, partial [Bifidobacterium bifidum]
MRGFLTFPHKRSYGRSPEFRASSIFFVHFGRMQSHTFLIENRSLR